MATAESSQQLTDQQQAVAADDDINTPFDIWSRYPELTNSKLFHEYVSRLTSGRDMHVIITASSETGVGKTTLAFVLAFLWDMNWWTADKATLDPREYDALYDEVGPGSALLLDEVEQAADSRRSGSTDNVNLSQAFATKRYRQVFGLMTAPTKSWVDGRIGSDSADYWIQAQETDEGKPKGEALVYRLKNNEHYEQSYSKRTETISWPILDWHPEFRKLEQKKVDRMEGTTQSNYVPRKRVEELLDDAAKEATADTENRFIRDLYQWGLTQVEIADIAGLTQPTISRRLDKMGAK